jgi:hypothetical protein
MSSETACIIGTLHCYGCIKLVATHDKIGETLCRQYKPNKDDNFHRYTACRMCIYLMSTNYSCGITHDTAREPTKVG